MTDIRPAHFPEDLDAVVRIFREYVASPTVSLDFQDFKTEFAALPGKYAAPEGCVLLAWKDGQPVGCAALRQVDAQTGEMKRVYVRPRYAARTWGAAWWKASWTPHGMRATPASAWTCCPSSRPRSGCMSPWVLWMRNR